MRKTTPYFVRKMIILQKLTTMDWLGQRLRDESEHKKEYPRMYFRYETLAEIKGKFQNGEVLSGLTILKNETETLEDHIWIVFGKKGSTVSIVPLERNNNDGAQGEQLIGLSYQEYTMCEEDIMFGLSRADLLKDTSSYCVMLPYKKESEAVFSRLYGVVFSDWDNLDKYGLKNLPTLCQREFGVNATRR